jgi:transcriptional regulator with XRE-family HTH domain
VTVTVLGGKGVLHVPDRRPPSVRARQLAAELRRLRDAARLTGEDVAGQLGWSPSKVSRIETGQTSPGAADLRRMLDIYDVTGTQRDRLERLAQSSDQRGWWDAYTDTLAPEYTALIALEAESESVRWYAPMMVPGLLQTERYAREVIRSGLLIAPPGEVERRVQVKMTRQRVLTRDDPLQMAVVIDEASILRTIGGPEVMREQLGHLTAMAARPNITVQVLPLDAGAHPALNGEFTILTFPDLVAPDVVYLENMASDLYVESEAEVYRYGLAFDRLRELALSPEESAELITERADSMG